MDGRQTASWYTAAAFLARPGQPAMEHTLQNLEAILEQVEAQGFAGIACALKRWAARM